MPVLKVRMPPRFKGMPGAAGYQLFYGDNAPYLIWNDDAEAWEAPAEARWHECGEKLASYNRLCTKLIGHGGEHGKRED